MLSTSGFNPVTATNPALPDAIRERNVCAALAAATGVVHLVMQGGATLTGTIDTTNLGRPGMKPAGHELDAPSGGQVKLTDSGGIIWLLAAADVLAVGQ